MAMRVIYLGKWENGLGYLYETCIDCTTEHITAEEYIRACEDNMDEPWWSDRANGETDYKVLIWDGDKEKYTSMAHVNDVLGFEEV